MTREVIAYTLIAAIVLTVGPWAWVNWRRRKRMKLRRRGIKDYGH